MSTKPIGSLDASSCCSYQPLTRPINVAIEYSLHKQTISIAISIIVSVGSFFIMRYFNKSFQASMGTAASLLIVSYFFNVYIIKDKDSGPMDMPAEVVKKIIETETSGSERVKKYSHSLHRRLDKLDQGLAALIVKLEEMRRESPRRSFEDSKSKASSSSNNSEDEEARVD